MKTKHIFLISIVSLAFVVAGIVTVSGGISELNIFRDTGLKSIRNAPFGIDDRVVTLKDGFAEEEPVEGLRPKAFTELLGEPVYGDLDNDGDEDAGLFLMQRLEDIGTFFYAAVAVNRGGKYLGSNAIYIGAGIEPKASEIRNNIFIVNYFHLKPDDEITEKPSVSASMYLKLVNGRLEYANKKLGIIEVHSPIANSEITSPLTISGLARGTWFFEGDFPILLTDWDGKIIAEGYATAQNDDSIDSANSLQLRSGQAQQVIPLPGWMTEEMVKFSGILEFEKPEHGNNGTLILKKDNPSGLLENDDALEMTVWFK